MEKKEIKEKITNHASIGFSRDVILAKRDRQVFNELLNLFELSIKEDCEKILAEVIDDLYLDNKTLICDYENKTHSLGLFKETIKLRFHEQLNDICIHCGGKGWVYKGESICAGCMGTGTISPPKKEK